MRALTAGSDNCLRVHLKKASGELCLAQLTCVESMPGSPGER
jgi:hypothetical protein